MYQRTKMKQIKNLLLTGATLFALTACGTNDSTTTSDNDNNSSQLERGNQSNNEHTQQVNQSGNDNNISQEIENSSEPYIAPTEFTKELIVGKTFYEAEDENEDGVFTINEWLQIRFISDNKIASARDGQKYPTNTYRLEVGKLFLNSEENGDVISLTSASQTELNLSTTDGDTPTWIFEVPLKETMVLDKTFKFEDKNKIYTVKYNRNHTLTLSNSTGTISEGSYEIKDGKLNSTVTTETTTKSAIKVNKKGDLLLWDNSDLKATWYYLEK